MKTFFAFFVRRVLVLTMTCTASFASLAQTKGMIVEPATGAAALVLDPNGDGYVSATTAGFLGNDQLNNELPWQTLIPAGSEPSSDVRNGPNCGFSDFVETTAGSVDPVFHLSTQNHWLFRFRMASIAPNAKSYSILVDIDNLIGPGDDCYIAGVNPGFELEIVLATKFGVRIYDHRLPCGSNLIYSYAPNRIQKSIAASSICNPLNFFLEFYVDWADITAQFGVNASTQMRYAIISNMAANKSSICNPNSASDIGGVNDATCGNLEACLTQIINLQPPCPPNNPTPCIYSACPTITGLPIPTGATSVSGTSTEPNGTVIRLYVNNVLAGTTTVNAGTWTVSPITPLVANSQVKASAQAAGKVESNTNCNNVTIAGAQCTSPLTTVGECGTNRKSITGTGPVGATVRIYLANGNLLSPVGGNSWTGTNVVVAADGTFVWRCTGDGQETSCNPSGGPCLANGNYYATAQLPGQCESAPVWFCINVGTTTSTPVISTAISTSTTTVTGTLTGNVAANNGVSIYLYRNNALIGSATTTNNLGAWTITVPSGTFSACNQVYAVAARNIATISCPSQSATVTVTGGVSAVPAITGTYCGTTTTVNGTSSESNGTTIQVLSNGNPVGTTTVTGGVWSLTGLNIPAGASITARATNTGQCKSQSAASAAVVVGTQNTNTVVINGSAAPYAPNLVESATTITGTGTAGDLITLYLDGWPMYRDFAETLPATATVGAGGTWSITLVDQVIYAGGVLTARASNASTCLSALSAPRNIVCLPPNTGLTVTPPSTAVCSNSVVANVQVQNSQAGTIYQLFNNNLNANSGSSVLGNGGTITLSTFALTANAVISVRAIKAPFDGTCNSTLTQTVNVTVNNNPTLTLTTQAQNPTICAHTQTNVQVLSSQSGFTYQLRNNANNAPIGSPVSGTGGTINLPTGNLTATTTFNVFATSTLAPTFCSGQLNNLVTVTVSPVTLANAGPNQTGAATCGLTSVTMAANAVAVGETGTWSIVSGTGGSFANINNPTTTFSGVAGSTYVLRWTIVRGSCSTQSDVTVSFGIIPAAPVVGTITQPTCAVNTGSVALSGLPSGSWTINPGAISGSGTTTTLGGLAAATTHNFTVTNTANSCTSSPSANVVVNAVPALPAVPTVASVTQPTCAVPSGTIVFNTQAGVEYSIGGPFQASPTFSGLASNTYTLTVRRTIDNTCTATAVNAVTINVLDCSDLSISSVASTLTPMTGQNVTFTITATNNGPMAATGVSVTDVLPSGFTLVSATPSSGTWSAPTWTIGNLANGASVTLTIVATVNPTGTYTHTVTINGANFDPNTANNTATNNVVPMVIAQNDINQTQPNTTVSGNVLTNDQNATQVTAASQGVTNIPLGTPTAVTGGTITINANGTYTFVPNAGYTGTVPAITYTAANANNTSSSSASLSVTVIPSYVPGQNNAPTANPVTATAEHGETITLNPLTACSDLDGNTLTVTSISGLNSSGNPLTLTGTPQNVYNAGGQLVGQASISGGQLVFTPNGSYTGNAPFTYAIADGNSGTASSTITVTVLPDLPNVIHANDDANSAPQGTTMTGNVLTNDQLEGTSPAVTAGTATFGGNSYPLTIGSATTIPGVGNVTLNANGTYTIAPLAGFVGTLPVAYTACNTQGNCDQATLYATSVAPAAVVAVDDNVSAPHGAVMNGNILANDTNATQVTAASQGVTNIPLGTPTVISGGTITINANGTFTFVPDASFVGAAPTISYTAANANNSSSDQGELNITVNAALPIAQNINMMTISPNSTNNPVPALIGIASQADPVTSFNVTAPVASQGTLSYCSNGTTPCTGTLIPIIGTVSITPAQAATLMFSPATNYQGTATFTYTASNGSGTSQPATVSIPVVNQAPVANSIITGAAKQNSTDNFLAMISASDADGTVVAFNITPTNPAEGTLTYCTSADIPCTGTVITISAPTTLTPAQLATLNFTPANNFTGIATFTFTATDDLGAVSQPATVIVPVTINGILPVNLPPVAQNIQASVTGNGSAQNLPDLFATDLDGLISSYTVVAVPNAMTEGSLTYCSTPPSSGCGTPVTPNTALTPAQAASLQFIPVANFSGTVSVSFYATDDTAQGSPLAYLTINVVNQAPVANNLQTTIPENSTNASLPVLSASDVDGTVDSYRLTAPAASQGTLSYCSNGTSPCTGTVTPINGTITLTPAQAATLTFTPAPNYTGAIVIEYFATDNHGNESAPASLLVNVVSNISNQQTTAISNTVEVPQNAPVTALPANFISASTNNGTIVSYIIDAIPSANQGTFSYCSNGSVPCNATLIPITAGMTLTPAQAAALSFQPAPNYTGQAPMTFVARNSDGLSSTPVVSIVEITNQAPVAQSFNTAPMTIGGGTVSINLNNAVTDVNGNNTVAFYTIYSVPNALQGTLTYCDTPPSSGCGTPVTPGMTLTPAQAATLLFTSGANSNQAVIPFNFTATDNGGNESNMAAAVLSMSNAVALPVELIGIQVSCMNGGKNAELTWQTASELNADVYVVERSFDGYVWEVIGTVQAAGTTNQQTNYSFLDNQKRTSRLAYYRLNQYDLDGTKTTYPIISSDCAIEAEMTLFPNPATEVTFVEIINSKNEDVRVDLFNTLGGIMSSNMHAIIDGVNLITLNVQTLQPGSYFVVITNANNERTTLRLVKQ